MKELFQPGREFKAPWAREVGGRKEKLRQAAGLVKMLDNDSDFYGGRINDLEMTSGQKSRPEVIAAARKRVLKCLERGEPLYAQAAIQDIYLRLEDFDVQELKEAALKGVLKLCEEKKYPSSYVHKDLHELQLLMGVTENAVETNRAEVRESGRVLLRRFLNARLQGRPRLPAEDTSDRYAEGPLDESYEVTKSPDVAWIMETFHVEEPELQPMIKQILVDKIGNIGLLSETERVKYYDLLHHDKEVADALRTEMVRLLERPQYWDVQGLLAGCNRDFDVVHDPAVQRAARESLVASMAGIGEWATGQPQSKKSANFFTRWIVDLIKDFDLQMELLSDDFIAALAQAKKRMGKGVEDILVREFPEYRGKLGGKKTESSPQTGGVQ